jgi:phosphoribosylglycinamide formyltransferase 1
MVMKKIGWFTTARGPGSYNLFNMVLDRIKSGEIKAKISFIFINREVKGNECRMKIIRLAEENDIPVIILPSDTFDPRLKEEDLVGWRDAYGKELRGRISRYGMDFGVLAGYMLIIDPETCRRYTLINLHPALPDTYKGTWEEIVRTVVENQDDRYGATIHVCSPELDCGDIIAYDSFDLQDIKERYPSKEDQLVQVRAVEVKREAPLLMEAIKLMTDGEVVLRNGAIFDAQGRRIEQNRCLKDRISSRLNEH